MSTLLIVFAKEPLPGKVKTRLSPPLPPEGAARLYLSFLADILQEMGGLPEISLALAYAPPQARPFFQSLVSPGTMLFPQKGRDLGERMAQAFARGFRAGFDRVLLRGSDTPHLPAAVVLEAKAALGDGRFQVTLGPCPDGGYYLIGLKALYPQLFQSIRWSGATVLQDTLDRARRLALTVHLLPTWSDIDSIDDLLAFLEQAPASPLPGWRSAELARRLLDHS